MTAVDVDPATCVAEVLDIAAAAGARVVGRPRLTGAGLSVRVASRNDLEALAFWAASELNERWVVEWDGLIDCSVGGVATRWSL